MHSQRVEKVANMQLHRKIPFGLLTSLLFMFSALEFAPAQCAIEPIKPIPPLGCKDVTPQCVSTSNGQSYWTWICVPDRGGADANEEREQQTPAPDNPISPETDGWPGFIIRGFQHRAASKREIEDKEFEVAPAAHITPVNPIEIASQTHVPISEDSKPAVETLRMVAQRIGECPKAMFHESQWGRKNDEIERLYYEPPGNLIWDVVAGNSVRAPYLAYVEFTVAVSYWVPESAKRRFFNWPGAGPTFKSLVGPWHYRYEYDLGPDGLQLIRVLSRSPDRTAGEWAEPTRDALAKACWDTAARDTQAKADVLGEQVVSQDDAQIASFRKAAEQGNVVAQYNLGALYEGGRGVPQDYAQATVWYRKAAEQGYDVAQYTLGIIYSQGRQGVPQDYTQAVVWYRKAAEQGYANAQFYLGIEYCGGLGVPENDAEGYFWIELAVLGKMEGVDQQDVTKALNLAASPLSKSERSQVQKRARKWFEDNSAKPQ
jgi:hypothetical protein